MGPNIPVTVGVLADMDYECFDGKVCYPEGVLAALLNPASLGGVKVNGGMFFCGDLAYANGNNTVRCRDAAWLLEPAVSSLPPTRVHSPDSFSSTGTAGSASLIRWHQRRLSWSLQAITVSRAFGRVIYRLRAHIH